MITAEREAWEAIADTLETIQGMPFFRCELYHAPGLCEVLSMMHEDGVIGDSLFWDMRERIRLALGGGTWLARPDLYKPRIRFARQFAKDSHD